MLLALTPVLAPTARRCHSPHARCTLAPLAAAVPYMPGGSKFMRNPPPPLDAVFPDGVPPEMNVAEQTIEGVQLSRSAWKEGYEHVLVDPYTKQAK